MDKPRLDQGPDYERGFIDGMMYQTQTTVNKAVNAMSKSTQDGKCAVRDCQNHMHQGQFVGSVCLPCYITPPQRPWVGLTGEDFSAIKFPAEMRFPAEFRAGARWAEDKLKEKNDG